MDYVNRTLLLSLKQDLLSLNESIRYFKTDADIDSWLFPTKKHEFVKEYIESKNILEVNNINIFLELIIDRLYVGIRLILTLLQNKIKPDVENYLIVQPQQLTIGCTFENLRKTIDTLFCTMDSDSSTVSSSDFILEDSKAINKKHEYIQTDIISLDKCDSCASALYCMKNLLTLFDVHRGDIYKTEQIQSNIYDLTQFGCMIQTTATIEKSLNILLNQLMYKDIDNRELHQQIATLNIDLQQKTGKIVLLEQECAALGNQNKKNAAEMVYLQTKICNLTRALSQNDSDINDLNSYTSTLKSKLSTYKTESKILHKQNKNISENFNKVKVMLDTVVKKLPVIEKRLLQIEKEHEHFFEEFNVLATVLDNLNVTLTQIAKKHDGLENKVKIFYSDSFEDVENVAKKFRNFKEKIQQIMMQSRLNDVKATESIPKIQVKGNPVEDISRQIEENNERIRTLQNENIKLENIVSKFKNLKK